ncbi:MAG: hypothetical protein H7833_02610 [Magnetococcus sp. DMHC-1]|nr:hypothetical protein [Magnetococcales bacterium]
MKRIAGKKMGQVRAMAAMTIGMAGLLGAGTALAEWYPQPAVQVGYTLNRVKTWLYETGYENPVHYWWEKNPSVGGLWDYQTLVNNPHQPVPYVRRTPVEVLVPQPVMAPVPVAAGGGMPARVRVQPTIPAGDDLLPEDVVTPQAVVIYR